jgi:CheY-like chemotaxis protein
MIRSESRNTLTILVVEDEALIRMGIVDALEHAGVTVIEASNADEAIRALETRRDIALVFTDIDMPGSMDGLRLAACIRDRWPPVRLIVTSGHVAVKEEDLPPGGRFFRKPYSAPEILRAMAEMTRSGA